MDAITEIDRSASQNKTAETRVVKFMKFEDEVDAEGCVEALRQGDIYVTRLRELPADLQKYEGNQLAPGNTQGSRHVLVSKADVKLHARKSANALQGPVIEAPTGFEIDHPEHGNLDITQGGIYAVTYQRAHAEELRRVAD